MIPCFGQSLDGSDLALMLDELLNSMGSAVTQEVGSLAWCEAYALAKCTSQALDFIRLVSNQLTPNNLNIYAGRMAAIYNLPVQGNGEIPSNLNFIKNTIALYQAQFGTPPNYANFFNFLAGALGFQLQNVVTSSSYVLGSGIFIDIEDAHEIQNLATGAVDGYIAGQEGYDWFSPLNAVLVRVWQPRDNNGNLLMPNQQFQNLVDSYKKFGEQWVPANIELRNMQLLYPGDDGSSNTISITDGYSTITGTNTKFTTDLSGVNLNGWLMPIEVVADNNQLYTYHVNSVISDTECTIVETAFNTVTNRAYRILGIEMDVPYGMDVMLFNI
jgi:hypothetical protein